VELYEFGVRSL